MKSKLFRVIDPIATGANIVRLRKERGLSVRDLQTYFGFEEPQAIYKWQRGQSLPTVDNLYALGALLEVPMDEILVQSRPKLNILSCEQQADAACCSPFFRNIRLRLKLRLSPVPQRVVQTHLQRCHSHQRASDLTQKSPAPHPSWR